MGKTIRNGTMNGFVLLLVHKSVDVFDTLGRKAFLNNNVACHNVVPSSVFIGSDAVGVSPHNIEQHGVVGTSG